MAEGPTEQGSEQPSPITIDSVKREIEYQVRLAVDVATKGDIGHLNKRIDDLQMATRSDIEHLNKRIDDLNRRVDDSRNLIYYMVLPLVVVLIGAIVVALFR